MRIEWLVAALNPRDIAPHLNFMREDPPTQPGLLALLAQLRLADYERLASGSWAPDSEAGSIESRLVRAVHKGLDPQAMAEGIAELDVLARSELDDNAAAVTAALFASVALSESDRHSDAVRILELVDDRFTRLDTADVRFARAVLLQQLAFRRSEVGLPSSDLANEALGLTADIRASELSTFRTSAGVRWRSSRTCSMILAELNAVADAHLVYVNEDLTSRDWVRLVRSPAPELDLLVRRSAARGMSRYLAELFESRTRSTARTFYTEDPVEGAVYHALLHYELVGAGPAARTWRAELGRLRILRQGELDDVWSAQDGIRLLRQSEDVKTLDLALRHVRAGGPLRALAGDVRQVVSARTGPPKLRRADLRVLSAGAHLLTQEEASSALDGVLSTLGTEDDALTRRWEAPSVRFEAAWDAAVALAGPAERLDEVAMLLLEAARSVNQQDELLVRALTRAASDIEWDGVMESTRSLWAEWLADPGRSKPSTLLELVGPQVGVPPSSVVEDLSGVQRAATLLNRYFRTGQVPDFEQLGDAPQAVGERLRRIRNDAARGTYSFGAISAPDVAAGLALNFGVEHLWDPLVELLLDRRVSRSDKAAPLERLAGSDGPLPADVARRLGDGVTDLLASPAMEPFGGRALTPFPAALRLAAAHSLLSDERVLAEATRLGGSYGTDGRIEAARTLALLSRIGQGADWITAMTLQLSHDEDPLVRGETGRGLASLARHSRKHADLIDQRLLDLLAEDGLIVPLLVLRGLQADGDRLDLPAAVARRVALVAKGHAAWGVRLQAQALIQE
jgi:hypothetical protein